MPVGVLRILFLDAARVRQDDAAEILRAGRAEDAAAETLRDEPRQIAAVIEVRVRQDDRVMSDGLIGRSCQFRSRSSFSP